MKSNSILVVDDEVTILKVISRELHEHGYKVETACNGEDAYNKILKNKYDLVILDLRMPKIDGISLLKKINKISPNIAVIMMTAFGSIKNAVQAMQAGAYDYLTKPFENDELIHKVEEALKVKSSPIYNDKEFHDSKIQLIGSSKEIKKIKNKIQKVKNLNTTVLITGESGTGKGVVAKLIHDLSNRSHLPFININCAVLPENLIESELFGHEKGAFTGAIEMKKGKFELAGKGTIFLDEIGTLSPKLQAKLLTVLQDKEMQRVGGHKNILVEARIIAATNENLENAVRRKEFREDLFYRLNVINVVCTPLRYRKEDIMLLTQFFVQKFNKKFNKKIKDISLEVKNILTKYEWPGNVRELENTIESCLALAEGEILQKEDLPSRINNGSKEVSSEMYIEECSYDSFNKSEFSFLEIEEIRAIKTALGKNNGHRQKTAEELGISRRTLQYKLKKFGLIKRRI